MIDNNKCTLANFVMEFITDVKEFMIQALVNFNFVNSPSEKILTRGFDYITKSCCVRLGQFRLIRLG